MAGKRRRRDADSVIGQLQFAAASASHFTSRHVTMRARRRRVSVPDVAVESFFGWKRVRTMKSPTTGESDRHLVQALH